MKYIMESNFTSDEKFNMLLEDYSEVHSKLVRKISVNKLWNIKEGEVLQQLGESWSDVNDPYYEEYYSEMYGDYTYHFVVQNCEGFKVIYDEDLLEEKWYRDLMWMLNTSPGLRNESEVLVNNQTKFKVCSIKALNHREFVIYLHKSV